MTRCESEACIAPAVVELDYDGDSFAFCQSCFDKIQKAPKTNRARCNGPLCIAPATHTRITSDKHVFSFCEACWTQVAPLWAVMDRRLAFQTV